MCGTLHVLVAAIPIWQMYAHNADPQFLETDVSTFSPISGFATTRETKFAYSLDGDYFVSQLPLKNLNGAYMLAWA